MVVALVKLTGILIQPLHHETDYKPDTSRFLSLDAGDTYDLTQNAGHTHRGVTRDGVCRLGGLATAWGINSD